MLCATRPKIYHLIRNRVGVFNSNNRQIKTECKKGLNGNKISSCFSRNLDGLLWVPAIIMKLMNDAFVGLQNKITLLNGRGMQNEF